MNPTEEELLSPDDAQPSAVADDNIPTDDEPSPAPIEELMEPPADCSSSPEIRMSPDDAESKSATEESPGSEESVDKTPTSLSSDHEGISNETITENREEEFSGENNNQAEGHLPSADEEEDVVPTEVLDTSCAQKDATTNNNNEERQEEKEILEERTDNDAEGCVDDTFVSVELSSSPSKNNSSYEEEVGGQQEEQTPLMDAAQKLNPSLEVAPTDAAMVSSIPSNDNVAAASKSSLNISQSPTTTTTTTRRRKILHHPILSHLTKLPWDRLTNAGSACDVIFNCKYSMKQVEDEVREECRRGVSGEGVFIEDYVGREDGYVNVSLNACSDYQYQEEGCEAGEFEQILTGCCSMLDNEEDSDDDDEEDVECVVPENSIASQKEQNLVQPMKMKGPEGNPTVDTNQKEGEEEREYSGDNNRVKSNNNELLQQQQSEHSWQQANPSLEMMMYRQFLNE